MKEKKFFLILCGMLFFSCHSQRKISLRQMNDFLLKNNDVYYDITYKDSTTINGIKKTLTKYRLSGAQSCNMNSDKKYSQIYIEDGFHDVDGFYNAFIIIENNDVCEITNSDYKLAIDSLSYTKVKDDDFVFYIKKISMKDFKKKYLDEYFRYQLVVQNKVNDLKKCLAIDQYTPKPYVYAHNYYFADKKINSYGTIKIKYNEIKDGIEGIPYLTEDKKKEFMDCVRNLNISID